MTAKTKKATSNKNAAAQKQPRVRKLKRRDKKKLVRTTSKLPNSFVLFARSMRHLWRHKKQFLIIFAIYLVLYVLLVKGLAANFQVSETRDLIEEALGEELDGFMTATTLFGALLGTAGSSTSESGNVYQLLLFIIFSLAIIWMLRHTFETPGQSTVKVRQAFYGGMYPLIQYIIVGLVIMLQLLPALIGMTVYGIVTSNGIAVGAVEKIFWLLLLILLVSLSVYMVSSSVFASYIVTLESMPPLKALRSARKVVKFRRFTIIRKVVFLPFVVSMFFIVLFIPLVLLAPVIAEILFLVLSLAVIFVAHTYLYTLYRELL